MLWWLSRSRTLHVSLWWRPSWRNHGTRLTTRSRTHPIVGIRIGSSRGHIRIMVISRVLLMLHWRLTVHLMLVMLWMLLVHRMMLRVMMHIVFVVSVRIRWTGIASRRHVMTGRFIGVHTRIIFGPRMRWMRRTGGRRRWSRATIASCGTGHWRFRFFATHYWATLRILSTWLSIGTIL